MQDFYHMSKGNFALTELRVMFERYADALNIIDITTATDAHAVYADDVTNTLFDMWIHNYENETLSCELMHQLTEAVSILTFASNKTHALKCAMQLSPVKIL